MVEIIHLLKWILYIILQNPSNLHLHSFSSPLTIQQQVLQNPRHNLHLHSLLSLFLIQAVRTIQHQVPKGWDKLSLSLISVETGKAIAKTGRSLVQNGNYQWTENLLVYIWVPHDDASTGHGQSLHKLLILMGSGRSGILGEVTVNLSSHLSSGTSTTVAEPLKNCSHETILQFNGNSVPNTKSKYEKRQMDRH
uniref:C2 domain-containing protein n=1 Tax=Helianthus annuus TaxID=4232 RepID=A0A251V2S4_HELAN